MTRFVRSMTLMLVLAFASPMALADAAPTWQCLGDNTIFALRIPAGKAFLEMVRERTRAGSLFYSEERNQKVFDLIKKHAGEKWDEFVNDLQESGMTPEDMGHFFDGEAGVGISSIPREQYGPLVLISVWSEPGEDIATRFVKAVGEGINKEQDKEHPTVREDIELGGVKVIHLTVPTVESHSDIDMDAEWEADDAGGNTMSYRPRPQMQDAKIAAGDENAAVEPVVQVTDYTHVFIARMGGRVLITASGVVSKDQAADEEEGKPIDWDKVSGVEEAKGAVAELLESHHKGGEANSFASRMGQVPGIQAAMPEGVTGLEMYMDFKSLFKVIRSAADTEGDGEMFDKVMASSGLGALGAMGSKLTLDGQISRGGMFVQLPSPRNGIMKIFDEQGLDAKPSAWVPSDVMQYIHVGLDLSKLYTQIKQVAMEVAGEEAGPGFQMAEGYVTMSTQTDINTLLGSFGVQHTLISEPPTIVNMPMGMAAEGEQPKEVEIPVQRMAMVWQVKDAALWERMMQMIGGFAGAANGAMQYAEEQGFKGWRFNQPPMQGGIFLGHGYLVLSTGEGMSERTLSAIANPPQGNASLQGHDRYMRVSQFMKLRPGILLQIVDLQRQMEESLRMARRNHAAGAMPMGPGMEMLEFFQEMIRIYPNADEIHGAFGPSAGQAWVDANGITMESAGELPPK